MFRSIDDVKMREVTDYPHAFSMNLVEIRMINSATYLNKEANSAILEENNNMSKQLYLQAHMHLKADQADEFTPIFKEHARLSRSKPGCLFFYLVRENDDPTKFGTMECWENEEYFHQHVADAEHKEFEPKLKKALAEEVDVRLCELVMGME